MLEKIVIWYCGENINGEVSINWFLTEEKVNKYQDKLDEGWGDCVNSVETFIGSNIYLEAVENSNKHNYLKEENFYEYKHIGKKAHSDKKCECCGKIIPIGEPHLVAKFYPEFTGYPIHERCEKEFKKMLN